MNWAASIPLFSAFTVVFLAGGVWAQVRAMRLALDKLEARLDASAKAQGERIGRNEDEISVLKHWQAKVEGAEERERDLSGVVRR